MDTTIKQTARNNPTQQRRQAAARLLAAAAALAAAVAFPAPASASTRGDAWAMRGRLAVESFRDDGTQNAYTYAAMAEASGRLLGWTNPTTTKYLNKVYALRNPDGGWGLRTPYDAFQDGTTNPANTTYTVTLADHVGPTLLAGYKAGVVPRARVQGVVSMLGHLPRVPVSQGKCVAYSTQAADAKAGMCVHNVNAGVGYFLLQAAKAGITTPGGVQLAAAIRAQEVATYKPAPVSWWAYYDGKPAALQDVDHEAYSAQSVYALSYAVGRDAALKVMSNAYPSDPGAPLAHMRLVSTPGGPNSWGSAGEPVTLWCEMGDRWLGEAYTYILDPGPASRWQRIAQAALFSARNAAACP